MARFLLAEGPRHLANFGLALMRLAYRHAPGFRFVDQETADEIVRAELEGYIQVPGQKVEFRFRPSTLSDTEIQEITEDTLFVNVGADYTLRNGDAKIREIYLSLPDVSTYGLSESDFHSPSGLLLAAAEAFGSNQRQACDI